MRLGLIGLGKMGFHLGLNLMEHGHQVVAYDLSSDAIRRFVEAGGRGAASVAELVDSLPAPRVVWLMVPQGKPVDDLLGAITPRLAPGDIVIEGGNSHYQDSVRRAAELKELGIHFLDVGTSGGIEGARHGACYMIGGDPDAFAQVEVLFRDTAVPGGYLYTGPSGSGHYAKMVHNGIEYGMMAAIGEGFEILEKSRYDYDFAALARVWSNGSVIRGWLMELTQRAFEKDPKLSGIRGVMHSSGEGKWTVQEALELQAAAPVIALSLLMRYRSLEDDTFTGKVVAALRNEFGGHAVERV
ncbi:MAG: decarboxylating 6-phosphogluconate dehydrogenase [Alicyclobacillus macrosporangiidus]|uniref:phosphogluconate dehydrogenase (NAD(+)-dependent, decarboxylating) n=1 Tax=Alicyclobacillus macrosporangiidus TaxID=392015 RepID=UPI0026ED4062|nr:decarboxylating 6-phosphogluconate dehydrogenase [Alicyclobacillus macrosporangiidus]MCL6599939.1 decarboxylating 6-phosphogluconate dehydrogenase [Alicyclobacillus macrosporangiidus]